MKISELIQKLQEIQEKRGDISCETFQHPEENEGYPEYVSNFYFREDRNVLIIS